MVVSSTQPKNMFKNYLLGTFQVIWWLRLQAFYCPRASSIPGQGTKIPHAAKKKKNLLIACLLHPGNGDDKCGRDILIGGDGGQKGQ